MRRLMLALSIASCIASPLALARNHHHQPARSGSHHTPARDHVASRHSGKAVRGRAADRFDASATRPPHARVVADAGRGRHHAGNAPRVPDEEEIAQPEQ